MTLYKSCHFDIPRFVKVAILYFSFTTNYHLQLQRQRHAGVCHACVFPSLWGGVRGGGKKGGGWGRLNTVKRGKKRSCRPKNEGGQGLLPLFTPLLVGCEDKRAATVACAEVAAFLSSTTTTRAVLISCQRGQPSEE